MQQFVLYSGVKHTALCISNASFSPDGKTSFLFDNIHHDIVMLMVVELLEKVSALIRQDCHHLVL